MVVFYGQKLMRVTLKRAGWGRAVFLSDDADLGSLNALYLLHRPQLSQELDKERV